MFSIPWKHKAAFKECAEEFLPDNGRVAELARSILEEFMTCIYGLEKSRRLGLVNVVATRIPYPEFLFHAIKRYREHEEAPADQRVRDREKEVEAIRAPGRVAAASGAAATKKRGLPPDIFLQSLGRKGRN